MDQLERDLTNHFDFCELAARFAKPAAALQTLIALGLLWRGHWWLLLLAAPLAAARIYALATSTYKLDPNCEAARARLRLRATPLTFPFSALLRADGRARQRRRQRTWLILHTVLCLFFLVNTGFFIFSVLRPTRLKLMRPVDIRW